MVYAYGVLSSCVFLAVSSACLSYEWLNCPSTRRIVGALVDEFDFEEGVIGADEEFEDETVMFFADQFERAVRARRPFAG